MAATATVSRRERNKARTRDAITEAALTLFAARGFDGTTVEDIADAADVAPRTFFRYFATKDDVVIGPTERELGRLIEALAARPADEPVLQSVRKAILAMADTLEDHRRQLYLQTKLAETSPTLAARSLQLRAGFAEMVAVHVATRLGVDRDADLRPDLVAQATVSALGTAISAWARRGGTGDLVGIAREALDLLVAGFGLDDV